MTKTISFVPSPPGLAMERRRPGRRNYTNQHLIQLLRNPADASGYSIDRRGISKDHGDFGLDHDEEAMLNGTISPFDGASQLGSLSPPVTSEQQGSTARGTPTTFLANQASYVAGVAVATPEGTVSIENITAGDVLLTMAGNRTVTWTRHFSVNPAAEQHREWVAPVCIRRDAIAPGQPAKDLWFSPTHCVLIENLLVPAGLLINGKTVVQDCDNTVVEYCHVLFDRPSHGRLAGSADQASPIWHRLAERAAHLSAAKLGLHLLADGKPVYPVEIHDSRQIFIMPSGCRELQLASRHEADVVKLVMTTQDGCDVIPADHPGLLMGWGPCRHEGTAMWRSVVGPAQLPLNDVADGTMIAVYLRSTT
jgi:Hint domain